MPEFNTGDTAWMLMSAAMVLFMTPGLAAFYAGMVRRKNVLDTTLQNFFAMGLIGVLWAVIGYSLAFTDGSGALAPFIGGLAAGRPQRDRQHRALARGDRSRSRCSRCSRGCSRSSRSG